MNMQIGRHLTALFLFACTVLSCSPTLLAQTIDFSHKTHAQDFAISCQFCHMYTHRAKQAGFPSLADCQGCHRLIKGSNSDQQDKIKKLFDPNAIATFQGWNSVSNLPDFVIFNHQFHVDPGVECSYCHGEVASCDAEEKCGALSDPTMGWCLDCHKKKHILKGDTWMSPPIAEEAGKVIQGSTDCNTCHQ